MGIALNIAGVAWKVVPRELRTWVTRRFHPTFTVSAAGIIVNDKGQVLLCDHVLRPASGWGVPGGFVDIGEQADAAVIREVKEETGIDVSNVRLYKCRTLRRHIEILLIGDGAGDPRPLSGEITQARWFDIDNMPPEMSQDWQSIIPEALERDRQK